MKRYKQHNHGIINQMNVVPYIDVMLVLLVIFMVTAPMFVPGVINLPRVGQAAQISTPPIQISVSKNGTYSLNKNESSYTVINLSDLIHKTKELLNLDNKHNLNNDTPVVISADKDVAYDNVIQVVNQLYANGVKKVALVVKQ